MRLPEFKHVETNEAHRIIYSFKQLVNYQLTYFEGVLQTQAMAAFVHQIMQKSPGGFRVLFRVGRLKPWKAAMPKNKCVNCNVGCNSYNRHFLLQMFSITPIPIGCFFVDGFETNIYVVVTLVFDYTVKDYKEIPNSQ